MPGLDGLRAVAVLAVVAYHLRLGWASGGLLGVGVFFTLSGYLITDLLLGHQERVGTLGLRDFWLRRARRLLPALFVMLAVVVIWAALLHQSQLPSLRGYVLAAALYVSNWFSIANNASYFARFAPPSPLDHLWSLAVEEQFYLLWPFVLWLLVGYGRKRRREQRAGWEATGVRPAVQGWWRGRAKMSGLTLLMAAGSTLLMALLYHPGFDPTRVYEGTDTRAAGLLVGAALAMVWPSDRLRTDLGAGTRRFLDGAGIAGLVVIGLLIWRTTEYSPWLYQGGILLLSTATAVVVAVLAHPATRLGRVVGIGPLRWLGVRSYGVYLWHYPIIVFTSAAFAAPGPGLATLQLTSTIGVAALSWRFVEEPIRRGALARFWTEIRRGRWRVVPRRTWAVSFAAAAMLALAGCGLAGLRVNVRSGSGLASARPVLLTGRRAHATSEAGPSKFKVQRSKGSTRERDSWMTSCHSIAYLGDSTSEGMVSYDYLPNPAWRLGARLRRMGVWYQHLLISGANSIVEHLPGQTNGYELAQQLQASGFRGCWIIALGTNDTADVYVGSGVSLRSRVQEMMSVIGRQPVMWVTVKTLLSSGPYSEGDMQLWNQTLRQACARYPNMRIFDWASVVKPGWFIYDGTHYTSAGYFHRAYATSAALVRAFPASGRTRGSGCVVI